MTRVVINQSAYLPWKGYFDLIRDADVFVFYDDAQFSSGSWRNRNRIKTGDGLKWLTIPVGPGHKRAICEMTLADPWWQTKHWKTLRQFLGAAPFFGRLEPLLREVYGARSWRTLSELNQYLIRTIARDFLGIRTKIVSSGDYPSRARHTRHKANPAPPPAFDIHLRSSKTSRSSSAISSACTFGEAMAAWLPPSRCAE